MTPGVRLGTVRVVSLVALSALALFPGLGSSGRLTYHEAFVAQGAREILASGEWSYPTIGGLPWLEKPPLPWWLAAALGRCAGGIDETVARLPSALAATGLVLGIAVVASRHYGPSIGLLAGAIQATTAWTVIRGRLAEADVLLACVITWTIVAFDRILDGTAIEGAKCPADGAARWHLARWAFFALLGGTALVKGIGFGAVLILVIVVGVLVWQRDGAALRRLWFGPGWALAAVLTLAWPLLMVWRHGSGALSLWTMHVADRLGARVGPCPFAGESWWEYVPTLLAQAMPWTPLALAGAWRSLARGLLYGRTSASSYCRSELAPFMVVAGDRLLLVWSAVPLALLAIPTVKNAHYAISAQIPWSIWAALALARVGAHLRRRAWDRKTLLLGVRCGFAALALAYGLSFWLVGPWFDRRGVEWAFYESAGRELPSGMSLALLYDDCDRNPYESFFGPIPHDLAVRLFYLNRPVCWHVGAVSLIAHEHAAARCSERPPHSFVGAFSGAPSWLAFAVVARGRDLPALEQLGHVEVIACGPTLRWDRTYTLFRVTPESAVLDSPVPIVNACFPSIGR